MTHCIICEHRPARTGGICVQCDSKIEHERRPAQSQPPTRYLTYQGYVVGLYPRSDGKLVPRLLKRSPDHLPKRKTLDLNTYLDGFSRDEVKRFKACVLSTARA